MWSRVRLCVKIKYIIKGLFWLLDSVPLSKQQKKNNFFCIKKKLQFREEKHKKKKSYFWQRRIVSFWDLKLDFFITNEIYFRVRIIFFLHNFTAHSHTWKNNFFFVYLSTNFPCFFNVVWFFFFLFCEIFFFSTISFSLPSTEKEWRRKKDRKNMNATSSMPKQKED